MGRKVIKLGRKVAIPSTYQFEESEGDSIVHHIRQHECLWDVLAERRMQQIKRWYEKDGSNDISYHIMSCHLLLEFLTSTNPMGALTSSASPLEAFSAAWRELSVSILRMRERESKCGSRYKSDEGANIHCASPYSIYLVSFHHVMINIISTLHHISLFRKSGRR